MTLSRGDKIDRYEVIELLGSGGMGDVYRARDPRLERDVALKILRVERALGKKLEERLFREARAAAALSHPNVVAVHDVGQVTEPEGASGVAYIAMELVVGRTLRAYVGDVSVAIDRRLGWLRDAAQALAAAHEAGIVHRDVKPENIMVRADGVVKVLDFGIARREQASVLGDQVPGRIAEGGGAGGVSNTTAQGVVVGTPRYMAPEQLRAESLDGRSDQFAWGVVAYELLTGTSPWPASSGEAALVTSILSVDPPPPIEHDENIPSRISDVILRALAKRRTSRFPSMKVLIAALEEGAGLKSTNRPATKESNASPMPTERLRRQRPLFVRVVVAMAAVAALAFLTIAAKRATTARGRRGEQSLPAARTDACVSNSECVTKHAGAPWRCNTARHTCAELTSPDCRIDVDPRDLARDDTVWFGGVFPMRPEDGWVGEMRAAKLARAEVSGTFGSSATHAGGFRARPIGLVLCEERENPALSARHLAEDVEAPAVIGFRSSSVVRSTVQSIFLPNRILSFVSICTDPDLTKIPEVPGEPRPIWRSTLSGTGIEDSLSALISDVLEPRARSAQRGLGEGPMRVAILDIRDDASSAALTSYSRTLRFNGKSAIENGDNFKQFVIDSSDDAGAGRALSALIDFSPQIVIPNSGTSQWMPAVLAAEDRWHGPPPFYIVGYGFAPWLDFIGTNPERRRRFFATTNASSTPTNMELVLRYNVAYPQDPVMKTDAPQPSYDAFYLLAYATYALGDEPVTGPALSRALERAYSRPANPWTWGPQESTTPSRPSAPAAAST